MYFLEICCSANRKCFKVGQKWIQISLAMHSAPPPRVTLSPFGGVLTPRIGICCTNPQLNGWNVNYSNEWDGLKKKNIYIYTFEKWAVIITLPLTTRTPPIFSTPHHLSSPSETARSVRLGCKSQLSQITRRSRGLFSFPLNTTSGEEPENRGRASGPEQDAFCPPGRVCSERRRRCSGVSP